MILSKRIVFIYTSLILIPLFIGILFFSSNFQNSKVIDIEQECLQRVEEYGFQINSYIDSFGQLESAIVANEELMLLLLNQNKPLSLDQILSFKENVDSILRFTLVTPKIYGIRLFVENNNIPEYWPLILNSSRLISSNPDKWEYNYVADFMGNLGQYTVSSLCLTRPLVFQSRSLGKLQISMKMKDFFSFLYTEHENHINNYVFMNKNDRFLPITNTEIEKNQPVLTDAELSLLHFFYKEQANKAPYFRIQTKDGAILFAFKEIPRMDAVIFTSYNLNVLNKQFLLTKLFAIILFFVTGILFFFVIRFITLHLMNRIFIVMNGLKEVGKGNLNVHIKIDGNDEVTETQYAFNKMIDQLKLQIKQIEQKQELVADTEVKAMQNQINAHFLYNVLETIKMQAVINDQEDIAESLTVLGKMMRYCLRWRVHKVSLQQEIDYILSYVYILNLRNDYVLSLDIDIDQKLLSIEIPKMVLQPIIENSFVHAIEPLGTDAKIRVYTELDEKNRILYLCIQDFGPGITPDKIESIRNYLDDTTFERTTKGSIGLKNIQQRLEMFYGKEYKIRIESELGKGTLICIPVPFFEDEK